MRIRTRSACTMQRTSLPCFERRHHTVTCPSTVIVLCERPLSTQSGHCSVRVWEVGASNCVQSDNAYAGASFSVDPKARTTFGTIAWIPLAMSHMGTTTSAMAFVIHPKQRIVRRPVGAGPAAKISINHTSRNATKTTAARLKPALSIHTEMYQRDIWSLLFGITVISPTSRRQ